MTAPFSPADPVQAARSALQRGEWTEVRAHLESWPGVADHSEGSMMLAEAYLRLGLPDRARLWLERVIPILERRADRAPLRRCVNMLGIATTELGELDRADAAYHRALSLAEADGDDLLLARATNNLGVLANVRGDREQALGNYQLAVPAYQRLGNAVGIAECYHNMAITYRDVSDLELADEYALRAIDFARSASNERLTALARLGRAEIILRRGDSALAGESARRVAEDFIRLSDPIREADARRLCGLSRVAEGDPGAAIGEIERAVALAREHGGALVEAESLRALAEALAAAGRIGEARDTALEAITLFQRLQATRDVEALTAWLEALL